MRIEHVKPLIDKAVKLAESIDKDFSEEFNERLKRQLADQPEEVKETTEDEYTLIGRCPCCGREGTWYAWEEYVTYGVCFMCKLYWYIGGNVVTAPSINFDDQNDIDKWVNDFAEWVTMLDKLDFNKTQKALWIDGAEKLNLISREDAIN